MNRNASAIDERERKKEEFTLCARVLFLFRRLRSARARRKKKKRREERKNEQTDVHFVFF